MRQPAPHSRELEGYCKGKTANKCTAWSASFYHNLEYGTDVRALLYRIDAKLHFPQLGHAWWTCIAARHLRGALCFHANIMRHAEASNIEAVAKCQSMLEEAQV